MIRRKYLHVTKEKTRHGKYVWYYRLDKASPRIRLPSPDDSPEFDAAYKAAQTGERLGIKPDSIVNHWELHSIGWLVSEFKASNKWKEQHLSTQRARALIIDKFVKDKGREPIRYLSLANIQKEYDERGIDEFLQIIRNMLKWAVSQNIVANNPAKDIKFKPRSEKGFTPWTIENVNKFRAKYPIGTIPRLVLELLLHTGLRRSDIVRLSTAHFKDGTFTINPAKTPKVSVSIPMHPNLKAVIDATPLPESKDNVQCLTYIRNQYGKAYSPEGFTNTFRKWAVAAALDDFPPHGGRKLAATLLAEAGATELQLMSAFGWTKADMAQHYTKSASRAKMGKEAWDLLNKA